MKHSSRVQAGRMLCRVVFALVVLLLAHGRVASAQQELPQTPAVAEKPEPAAPAPGLADIVPLATALAERLGTLGKSLKTIFDLKVEKENLATRQQRLADLTARFQALTYSRVYGYDQLADLKGELRAEAEALKKITQPVSEALTRLDAARKEWSAEKETWSKLESSPPKDVPLDAVRPTLAEAQTTVDRALALVTNVSEPLLAFQREAGDVQTRLQALAAELDALLEAVRGDIFRKSAFSFFSPDFYAQFNRGLWSDLRAGIRRFPLPYRSFFVTYGWVVVIQALLSVGLIAGLLSGRLRLEASDRWRFLRLRPIAAALFVGVSIPALIYGPVPPSWSLLLWAVIGVSLTRLLAPLVSGPWKRRVLYLLAALFLTSQTLRVLGVPLPLFRVYVVLVALGGMPLCLWRARVNASKGDGRIYVWALRTGAGILCVVFLTQVLGYSALASHLLESSIKSTFLVLIVWMLARLARGGVEFLLRVSMPSKFPALRRIADGMVQRTNLLIDVAGAALAIAWLLEIWRVFDTATEAFDRLLSFGFSVGEQRLTVGIALGAMAIFYGAYLTSLASQALLMEQVYPRRHVEYGTRFSMNRLVHYAFVFVGFFVALSFLGVQFRNITILAGAFGIGIGFGLQTIVNNFVSGLILLFERPIKVGDMIQFSGEWGHIKKMGLRATVVQTLDQSEVIVPNSDLISAPVTNWTFSDRRIRIVIPVGVVYGSDVQLTMRILREVASADALALKNPEPQVYFMEFGDSSLNFELRVWIPDIEKRFQARSDIHQEIDRRFREARIEIAFPQRDLHLRTVAPRAEKALTVLAERVQPDDEPG